MAAGLATESVGTQAVAPILVALDTTDPTQAGALANALRGHVGGLKLGLEFFMANGAAGVARISELGQPVFLDLKFHDIPNTVAGAVRAVAPLCPFILNVHASGGRAMMVAAREAAHDRAAKLGVTPPKLIAVTVLTSFAGNDLAEVGQPADPQDQVRRLAALTRECGLDGVVCSAKEIAVLRQDLGADFLLVTPGIRPAWAATGDQKRIMTPAEAMEAGADYLVIGRPITSAGDPVAAAKRIADEIASRPGNNRTRA
ncbi:orotidine-5'-phosphate decarboxylase [Dongia soli]|uniref:Orotidine 5'-phosphate decarboxylase n=1 Tax=Dongia soli TaxID=600628 RepID=A0ABU5E7V8_9PROT|nr:orotidine-5'-phosphate decarboxylase [Dongia soli]MDY0882376.1 orotidine-5'-phosphate decarboxylase [Dongia soli]